MVSVQKGPRSIVDKVTESIQRVVGPDRVELHEPWFRGNEKQYLCQCIDSTYVSSSGEFIDRFENEIAEYTKSRYAIAVVNGTSGLHIALLVSGVTDGDEVLLPGLTFVATANAISYCRAIPHFVDAQERTMGIDPCALRDYLETASEQRGGMCINKSSGRRISSVVPMHTFGHPTDMNGLLSVASDFNLTVVEDAAESIGSLYDGIQTGTFGKCGVLSFNGNKTITTGGGGVILTNDLSFSQRARYLVTTAKVPGRLDFYHDQIGYNYRMPNINAALGCAQLENLGSMLRQKKILYERYRDAFSGMSEISVVKEPENCQSNYWLQAICLDHSVSKERDTIIQNTNQTGIGTRPPWTILPDLPMYSKCPSMELHVARSLQSRIVCLPSSAFLAVDS